MVIVTAFLGGVSKSNIKRKSMLIICKMIPSLTHLLQGVSLLTQIRQGWYIVLKNMLQSRSSRDAFRPHPSPSYLTVTHRLFSTEDISHGEDICCSCTCWSSDSHLLAQRLWCQNSTCLPVTPLKDHASSERLQDCTWVLQRGMGTILQQGSWAGRVLHSW